MHILQDIATEEDFVVVKLDIDNTEIEMQFIDQIINTPRLAELVDELYFENHVTMNPMAFQGWELEDKKHNYMNISRSYQIFMGLRQLGIMAHSWV